MDGQKDVNALPMFEDVAIIYELVPKNLCLYVFFQIYPIEVNWNL